MTDFILWKQWNIIKFVLCQPVCNKRSKKYMQSDHWSICPRIPSPTMTNSSFLGNSTRTTEEYFLVQNIPQKTVVQGNLKCPHTNCFGFFFSMNLSVCFFISNNWMAFNILWQIIIITIIIIIIKYLQSLDVFCGKK